MTSDNYFSWCSQADAAFLEVSQAADIAQLLARQTLELGLAYYALYIRHPVPFTRPEIFVYTNYPEKWVHKWTTENFAESDPIIRYCQIPGTLLLWDDPVVKEGKKCLKLQYLTELAMDALLCINDRSMCVRQVALSPREKEILKWTAVGKAAAEILLILSISEYTVNFYQKNMQKKFNVPNKTQVASYAAALGLL